MNICCVWRVERYAGDRRIVCSQCVFLQITYLIEIVSSNINFSVCRPWEPMLCSTEFLIQGRIQDKRSPVNLPGIIWRSFCEHAHWGKWAYKQNMRVALLLYKPARSHLDIFQRMQHCEHTEQYFSCQRFVLWPNFRDQNQKLFPGQWRLISE